MRKNNVQIKRVMWHAPHVSPSGEPVLGYDDGRKVKVGKFLGVTGEPVLCHRGLHAAFNPQYALDLMENSRNSLRPLTVVTLWGKVKVANDKAVATRRYCHAIISHERAMLVATRWLGVVISRCITSDQVPPPIWALLTEGEYQEAKRDEYVGHCHFIRDLRIRSWVGIVLASYRSPSHAWLEIRRVYSDALYFAASRMSESTNTSPLIAESQLNKEHMLYWELRSMYDVLLADMLLEEAGLTEQEILNGATLDENSTTDE